MDVRATIVGIIPFEIQDDPYLTIYYVHDDDPGTVLQARLPSSAVYEHPHPNDQVHVHYVLGVVTHVDRREATATPPASVTES